MHCSVCGMHSCGLKTSFPPSTHAVVDNPPLDQREDCPGTLTCKIARTQSPLPAYENNGRNIPTVHRRAFSRAVLCRLRSEKASTLGHPLRCSAWRVPRASVRISWTTSGRPHVPPFGGAPCAVPALCARCAKSQLFSTAGSHGSQGPEFCTLPPPCWYTRDFFLL